MLRRALLVSLLFPLVAVAQEICVTDDAQQQVCLDEPAQRVVALSPGAVELIFAAGAGERLVGASEYSDYPEAAQEIPRVGNHSRVDMERLVALAPDLVIAWGSGNPSQQIERLQRLGMTVYFSEPGDFATIATSLERFAQLTGRAEQGRQAAEAFRARADALQDRYANQEPVTVFYQIWDQPLMTINGDHYIDQAIRVCGGQNLFADLPRLTPRVDHETVLAKDPEAVITGGEGEDDRRWVESWKRFDDMTAVQRGNLFFVPPSTVQRPTPRLLDGAEHLCRKLEQARERR